jgi:glycosyltransferase involved in cell wall biosynthesis
VPNVIKEALALGTPVVATEVAGIPELLDVGRCGLLVPPRDVGALASAIERLLTNPQLRRELATTGRRFAEKMFDQTANGRCLAEMLRATTRAR